MKPARLLRWYPRAWRERYGEELLALIQDTLDEGRPTWRLRLGVIWGGLRERAHQAVRAGKAAVKRAASRWLTIFVAGMIFGNLPQNLKKSLPPARAWQATAAFDVLAAVAAHGRGGSGQRPGGLPAAFRFLRAGGWPKIRRRVAWAAGATGLPAARWLALSLALRSLPKLSWTSRWPASAFTATALALVVAIGLWAAAVTATAKHLKLAPRARAVELVLGAVISTAVSVMVAASIIWLSAAQASVPWLLVGIGQLVLLSTYAPWRIERAARKGRRLRTAAATGLDDLGRPGRRPSRR